MLNIYIEPRVKDAFGQLIHGVMAQSKGQLRQVKTLGKAQVAIVSTKQSKKQALAMLKYVVWVDGEPRRPEDPSVRFIRPQLEWFQLDLRCTLNHLNSLATLPA